MATDGAEGIEGFDGERLFRAVPPKIRPVKTIGGGDAAAAGIVLSVLERGWDLKSALASAAAMGTASCLNAVGGQVSPADVESLRRSVTVREIPPAS